MRRKIMKKTATPLGQFDFQFVAVDRSRDWI